MLRPRDLKKAADLLPKDAERKWHNMLPQNRRTILSSMADLRFNAVYSVVDKNNPPNHRPVYGNELYWKILKQVISDAMDVLPCKDFNVFLDSSHFISADKLREIVREEATKHGVNVKRIDKIQSGQNKCIQLADFVAGASRSLYEHEDNSINIIAKKISIARRH